MAYIAKGAIMAEVITIMNRKGGVGKTTTAHAIAAGLALQGKRTLLIDLDGQGNISRDTGTDQAKATVYEMIIKGIKAADVIQNVKDNLDAIPAKDNLSKADTELTGAGKENRLKEALLPIKKSYDYIVLDTPPALNILTVNALTASNSVIIPANAEIHSIEGIGLLKGYIDAIRHTVNKTLKIKGIVLTQYSARTVLARDMKVNLEKVAGQYGIKVFTQSISTCVAVAEAQAYKQDIFAYAPRSKAAKEYKTLIDEAIFS